MSLPIYLLINNKWDHFIGQVDMLSFVKSAIYSLSDDVVGFLDGSLSLLTKVKLVDFVIFWEVLQKEKRIRPQKSHLLELLLNTRQPRHQCHQRQVVTRLKG